jgi:Tfp pilus assembly protein PilF
VASTVAPLRVVGSTTKVPAFQAEDPDVAENLARLIRGDIDVRDFPWLSDRERRALATLGISTLRAGKYSVAKAAFRVLIDLEPEVPAHYLMHGHAATLMGDTGAAFHSFTRAIRFAMRDDGAREVAAEAFLARGDLLLKTGRMVEARADFADALHRIDDPARRKTIEAYLAS